MSFPIPLLDFFQVQLRVNLGRGDGFVPKQLLHRSQIRAALEQVDSIGVSEDVRADSLLQTNSARNLLQALVSGLAQHGQPAI